MSSDDTNQTMYQYLKGCANNLTINVRCRCRTVIDQKNRETNKPGATLVFICCGVFIAKSPTIDVGCK